MRKGCGGTGIEGDEGDSFGHVPGGSLIPIRITCYVYRYLRNVSYYGRNHRIGLTFCM